MTTPRKTSWSALIGTLLLSGAALAVPRLPSLPALPLTVRDSWCTSEPSLSRVNLHARTAAPGRIRIAVTASGEICRGPWIARRDGQQITLTAQRRADVASLCGTCGSTVEVADLAPGEYIVTVDGVPATPLIIRAR
jgi:hypothetical protein